jgi:hypothetical protein
MSKSYAQSENAKGTFYTRSGKDDVQLGMGVLNPSEFNPQPDPVPYRIGYKLSSGRFLEVSKASDLSNDDITELKQPPNGYTVVRVSDGIEM